MFISTRVTIDIATGKVLHREGFEYSGLVAECKGDQALKDQEMSQAAFTKKLQSAFQTHFASQQGLLSFLNPKLEAMITNPQGYSPEALAAARTNAITQNAIKATQAQAAGKGRSNCSPFRRSGTDSGADRRCLRRSEELALTSIEQQNEDLKNQNMLKGVAALSGDISALNPDAYAGSANQGSSVVGSLGTAYNQTQQDSLWSKLGDSLLSALLSPAGPVAGPAVE